MSTNFATGSKKYFFSHSIAMQVIAVLYFWNKKLFWKVTSALSCQTPHHHHHLQKFSISLVHFLFIHIQSDICLNYCSVKLFHKRCVFWKFRIFSQPLIVGILVAFVWFFSTVRFQMCPQTACPRGCISTLVASVWLFSTVSFQMCPQIAWIRAGIITLVASVWLFSTVSF